MSKLLSLQPDDPYHTKALTLEVEHPDQTRSYFVVPVIGRLIHVHRQPGEEFGIYGDDDSFHRVKAS